MAIRLRPLSAAIRLPLLAGLAVFVTSASTTRVAIHFMEGEAIHQAERLADVYLDSLSSAAVRALDSNDMASLQQALETALGFQTGAVDRIIVVGRPDGTVLARAGATDAEPPMSRGELGRDWELNESSSLAWAQRQVEFNGAVVALAAVQLAFPDLVERRRGLILRMVIACLLLAVLSALFAVGVARRMMGPVLKVTQALEHIAARAAPVDSTNHQTESERLSSALDMLLTRLEEREELAARLTERERVAVLGRLAATVAHEVRNPLAGMLTSVDTIRHYGNDPMVRHRSLDLVERGLRQIETVVRTTLAVHREPEGARPLAPDDLDDLKLLVAPEARRRSVRLDWQSATATPFPADAVRLRQVVLNLLLNAIAATPAGKQVSFTARVEAGELTIVIEDEAGGMPDAARIRLEGEATALPGEGVGLEVATRLTAALRARIAVQPTQRGSRIILTVPPAEDLHGRCN